jgi:hypothetical protein
MNRAASRFRLGNLALAVALHDQVAAGAVEHGHGFLQLAFGILAALHGIDMAGQFDLQRLDLAEGGAVGSFLG